MVQGAGGCGKSTLYKALAGANPGHVLCLASTGIAAQNLMDDGNLSASTIHSAFGLKPVDMYWYRNADFERNEGLLNATDMILIDEMSMVNISLMEWIFSLMADAREGRHGRGIKLVLFGDVLQLPPILKPGHGLAGLMDDLYGNKKYFFNASSFARLDPELFLLSKVYRQSDAGFSAALNSLRSSVVPGESLDLINSCVCTREEFARKAGGFFVTVVGTNREKDEINKLEEAKLEASGAECHRYTAEISGDVDKDLLSRIPQEQTLYKGQHVMCTANSDDYRNGTMGLIVGFTGGAVPLPIIRKQDGTETQVLFIDRTQPKPIVGENGSIEYEEAGSISQIACQPAYAVTIHKTQGLTLDRIYYKLGSWIPPSGVYVALSRCRTLGGIGLSRPIRRSDVTFDPEAMEFFRKFLIPAA